MSADRQLIAALRAELERHADPGRARHSQAYLKTETPCLGVTVPLQRELAARVAKSFPLASFEDWRDTVLELWRGAEYREELSCAVHLSGQRAYRVVSNAGVRCPSTRS